MGKETNKERNIALCCGISVAVLIVLVIGGVAGYFIREYQEKIVETVDKFANETLLLLDSEILSEAKDNLAGLLGNVTDLLDIGNSFDNLTWLEDPVFYTKPVLILRDDQQDAYIEEYGDIFYPIEDYRMLNESGDGQLSQSRRRRSSSSSLVCPGILPPGETNLVIFTDGGQGQLARFQNRIQWAFNEECSYSYCQGSAGCSCTRKSRQVTALVNVFNSNGQIQGNSIYKSVYIYSCQAVY